MAMDYVNRRGERYYLCQGKTKTGKPKYYVSRKPSGEPVEQMPEGFEFYEEPERGIVAVRKIRATNIPPQAREKLLNWTAEWGALEYCRVEIEGDSLVVYTPDRDPGAAASLLGKLFGSLPASLEQTKKEIAGNTRYLPMLRFTLIDAGKELFSAERWCFRGAIDDWLPIGRGATLEVLARKLLPHLNEESFFELF